MRIDIDIVEGFEDNQVIAQREHQVFADGVALVAFVFGFILNDEVEADGQLVYVAQEFLIIETVPELVHGQGRKLFQIFAGIIDVQERLRDAAAPACLMKDPADFGLNFGYSGKITHHNRIKPPEKVEKTKKNAQKNKQFNYNRKNNA